MTSATILRGWTGTGRWLWAVLVVGVLLATAAVASHLGSWESQSATPSSPGEATTIIRAVHALGRLEPRGTVIGISAPSGNEGARVERLDVEEGSDVQPGQILAVLDVHARRLAALDEARARLAAEEARLAQIEAGAKAGDLAAQQVAVAQSDAELTIARRDLERARQLRERKVLTSEEFDLRQLAFDRAELESQRSRAVLDSLREVRLTDVLLQKRQIEVAAAAVRRAQADVEAAVVKAPSTGKVLRIHNRAGERIGNSGLLELGDVSHMQAVAEVFEGDVGGVEIGQRAIVRMDSSGERMTGVVTELGHLVARKDVLSNDPVSDTDARVLEVRIDLVASDAVRVQHLANARVEVQIEVQPQAPIKDGTGLAHRR